MLENENHEILYESPWDISEGFIVKVSWKGDYRYIYVSSFFKYGASKVFVVYYLGDKRIRKFVRLNRAGLEKRLYAILEESIKAVRK